MASVELQVKILELISKSESQLPLIAEEYLSWHLTTSFIWLGAGIFFLALAVIIFSYRDKIYEATYMDEAWLICLVSLLMSIIIIPIRNMR
jgi:hypothetical protein